jgi:hypothetical protein
MSSSDLDQLKKKYKEILENPNTPDLEERLFALTALDTTGNWWFINPNSGELFCYDFHTRLSTPANPKDFVPADLTDDQPPTAEDFRKSLIPPSITEEPAPPLEPLDKKSSTKQHNELLLLGVLFIILFGVTYFKFIKPSSHSITNLAPPTTQIISGKTASKPSIGVLKSITLTLANPQNSPILSAESYLYDFTTKQADVTRSIRSGTAKGTYQYYSPNYTRPQAYAYMSKVSYWIPLQAPLSYSSGSYRSGTLDWLAAILTAANKVQLTPTNVPDQKTLSVVVNGFPSTFKFTFSKNLLSQISFDTPGYKPLIYAVSNLNQPPVFPRVVSSDNKVINP